MPAGSAHLLTAPPRPWRRTLLNALLFPAALLAVLVEDVIWRGANASLRGLRGLAAVRWLAAQLGRLPGWLALPLFLVPEGVGRLGELWAIVLVVHGHVRSAVAVYIVVRLLATLLAVFVFQSCEVALMQVAWFAAMIGWVRRVRDWAMALIGPWRARLYALGQRGPSPFFRRIGAMRRALLQRWRGRIAGPRS